MIRIVKVGGSLFGWPKLPRALESWLANQSPAIIVLIAGGGRSVDSIRQASRTLSLTDEAAHWLAIDAMSANSRLLADLLTDVERVADFSDLRSSIARENCRKIVFDPHSFLRHDESHFAGCRLPHDWSVTSDSIAARLAEVLEADELVLLKSADPSDDTTSALAVSGLVDRYFPAFDRCSFRRRVVNLRQAASRPGALNT